MIVEGRFQALATAGTVGLSKFSQRWTTLPAGYGLYAARVNLGTIPTVTTKSDTLKQLTIITTTNAEILISNVAVEGYTELVAPVTQACTIQFVTSTAGVWARIANSPSDTVQVQLDNSMLQQAANSYLIDGIYYYLSLTAIAGITANLVTDRKSVV